MSYLELGFLGISLLTVIIGFLLGFKRGLKRSILRTVLLILCIVGAYFLKDMIIDILLKNEQINKAITDLFTSNEMLKNIGGQLMMIVESLLKIILFIVLVLILQFISWSIIYPICKIFVKKPPFGKKKRLAGGLLGIITSLAMCLAVLAPLSCMIGGMGGLVGSLGSIAGEKAQLGGATEIVAKVGITDYKDSAVGKMYSKTGGWFYKMVSTVDDESTGKKTNFDTQIGALTGAVKLAGQVMSITKLDFTEMFSSGDTSSLIDMMKELDKIKNGDLNEEQKEALSSMIKNTVGELMGGENGVDLGIDFDKIDIMEIEFEKEAMLFDDYSKISSNSAEATDDELEKLVDDFAHSKIMLSVVDQGAGSGLSPDLSEDQKSVVKSKIKNGGYDADVQNKLNKLFGFSTPIIED